MKQAGFFDLDYRFMKIDRNGDPLSALNDLVDWESFRPVLEKVRHRERRSRAGRKPYDVVLMFKILVLQSLYNLSDEAAENQILDRLSFMRFLGLELGDNVPDAKTIWLFREDLTKMGLVEVLFEKFDSFLRLSGFVAQKGQIIDASIVQAPKQRNSHEENERIKRGEEPGDWNRAKRRQKDVEARWVKKHGQSYYGYKNHLSADVKHKFIRRYEVTPASVHDSNIFSELLDENNTSRDVWADSAYNSKEKTKELSRLSFRGHIQRKGCRGKSLSEWEKRGNRTRSKTRCRIEHIFGVQAQMAGNLIIRSVGLARAKTKIGLRNLSYNLYRYKTLMEAMA